MKFICTMFHALARPADANDSIDVTSRPDPPRDRDVRASEAFERGAFFVVDADDRDPDGRVCALREVERRDDELRDDAVRGVAVRDVDARDDAPRVPLERAVSERRVDDGDP